MLIFTAKIAELLENFYWKLWTLENFLGKKPCNFENRSYRTVNMRKCWRHLVEFWNAERCKSLSILYSKKAASLDDYLLAKIGTDTAENSRPVAFDRSAEKIGVLFAVSFNLGPLRGRHPAAAPGLARLHAGFGQGLKVRLPTDRIIRFFCRIRIRQNSIRIQQVSLEFGRNAAMWGNHGTVSLN